MSFERRSSGGIAFEIPCTELEVSSPGSKQPTKSPAGSVPQLTPRRLAASQAASPKVTVAEIEKKLEQASERRNIQLKVMVERNESAVTKAVSVAKDVADKLVREATERIEKLEIDHTMKQKRRQQILDERIGSAKKQSERVEEVLANKRSLTPKLRRDLEEDMSNKENNRRAVIQGIVDHCKIQAEKVEQAKQRRSGNLASPSGDGDNQ